MDESYVRCKGTTAKGERCKLRAIPGTDYCHYHQEERQRIVEFFNDHKEGIAGFLAGAISDPIMSDIYNFLKRKSWL